MRFASVLLLLAAGLAAAEPDALDRALARLGLDRAGCRPDPALIALKGVGDHRLPMVDAWLAEPLRIPAWEHALRQGLLAGAGRAEPTLAILERCADLRTWRAINDPPPSARWKALAADADGLAKAVLALDPQAKPPAAGDLPPALRRAATVLLACAADLVRWREIALRRLDAGEQGALFAALIEPLDPLDGDDPARDAADAAPAALLAVNRSQDLLEKVDLRSFAAGADDLATALAIAEEELKALPMGAGGTWECATALGAIRLGGPGDDAYDDRAWLLVIDSGGDDRYAGGGASVSATQAIGILIDRAGSDRYHAAAGRPAFGAGVLGWGVLVDLAGNDGYAADGFLAEGAAHAGVGWLDDRAGDDTYRAAGGAQGFARWGLAWLVDHAGDDRYDTILLAQGCGCPRGAGLLFDRAGGDTYRADDENLVAPSAQSKQHNCSCVQGAGFGERRDLTDGRSQAGGVGILLDADGDDAYSAGVFAQAVGFWHGIGILDDRAGSDRYRGVWYAQSATAHFGVSCLVDGGGDDLYDSAMCMAVAAAHDAGVSVFLDDGGNDTYRGGAVCGQALHQAVAVFADLGGDDTYQAGVFGRAGDTYTAFDRTGGAPGIAVFLDLGGHDAYPAGAAAGADRTWVQPAGPATGSRLLGTGEDAASGALRW